MWIKQWDGMRDTRPVWWKAGTFIREYISILLEYVLHKRCIRHSRNKLVPGRRVLHNQLIDSWLKAMTESGTCFRARDGMLLQP